MDLTLRDDRGARLDEPVLLTVRQDANTREYTVRGGRGRSLTVPLESPTASAVLHARYEGDARHAGSSHEVQVRPGDGTLSLQLLAPSTVDLDDTALRTLIATVQVDGGSLQSPAGRVVRFALDGAPIGQARADAAGRAVLSILPSSFTTPGVHALSASVDGAASSVSRRLVVRALTSIVVTVAPAPRAGALRVHGALAWRGGPVSGASVTLREGPRTLAGFVCDPQGSFAGEIPASALAAGRRGRIVFSPTTPWFSGSESGEFWLSPQRTPKLSWRVALLAAAAGGLVLSALRARRAKDVGSSSTQLGDALTLEVGQEDSGSAQVATLVILAEDKATGSPLEDVRAEHLDGRRIEGPLSAVVGSTVTLRVDREGYAPREISVTLPRAGAMRLRVGLSVWRDAAFDIVRPLTKPSDPNRTLKTPREVSEHRHETTALMERAELLVYGPRSPTAGQVAELDALSRSVSHGEH